MRCAMPGEDVALYVVPEEAELPKPPDGFVDTRTIIKRINPETGEEEIVKILDYDRNVIWQKGDEEMAAPAVYDWDALLPKYYEMKNQGLNMAEIAQKLNIPYSALRSKLQRERAKDERVQKPVEIDPDGGFDSGDGHTNYDPEAEESSVSINVEGRFEDEVIPILNEIGILLVKKRKDYGPGNIPRFGEKGVVVRLYDKAERLASLVWDGKAPNFESVEDTWMDVIGYGVLGLLEHRRRGTVRRD